jgi:hypothetical protein
MATAPRSIRTQVQVMLIPATKVQPGDTLIIQVSEGLSERTRMQIRNRLLKELPDFHCVLVPCLSIMVQPGPQLDDPARPLVDPPADFYTQQSATYDPARSGVEQGRPVF